MNAINYRMMNNMDEMILAEDLQHTVWGMSPAETLSAPTIRWMIHIGGLLLGAWDDNKLVGFCIGLPGKREDKWIFWSDMAGVDPKYQGQGIGYQLKIKQRDWVRGQGYDEIRWTFDPMRRGNAFFNFHKLGAISSIYHPKFYGNMQDNINIGLPADRLEAVWSIEGKQSVVPNLSADVNFVVKFDEQQIQTQLVDDPQVLIQIPYDLDFLKSSNLPQALEWQKAVREAFIHYFANGYQVIDFVKNHQQCWYILYQII